MSHFDFENHVLFQLGGREEAREEGRAVCSHVLIVLTTVSARRHALMIPLLHWSLLQLPSSTPSIYPPDPLIRFPTSFASSVSPVGLSALCAEPSVLLMLVSYLLSHFVFLAK